MQRKKIIAIWALLVLATAIIGGCAAESNDNGDQDSHKTIEAKLYYATEDNEKLIAEIREVTYSESGDEYRAVLEELLKRPTNAEFRNNIPSETRVNQVTKEGTDLIVDLSGFQGFGGELAEILAVGSIVNTMTSLPGIERVKILVDGKELIGPSGQPRGFMTFFSNPGD